MARCVGIDLGTTRSAVAVLEDGQPVLLRDPAWGALLPSALALTPSGELVLGHDALRAASAWPERAATSVKRLMGRRFSELGALAHALPYPVHADPSGDAAFMLGPQRWTPPQASAQLLMALKRCAERSLGEPVEEAVIAVPAYFNDDQRKATRDAAALAGLKVRRLLHEPTAAALAFRLAQGFEGEVAVYDLGGGTFDISILRFGRAGVQVLAVNGDPLLGGDDLTRALLAWAAPRLRVPDPPAPLLARLLWEQAEAARVALSSQPRATLLLPPVHGFAGGALEVERAQLDALLAPFVARTLDLCRQALHDADLEPRRVGQVLLVGGVTHTPLVRAQLQAFFGGRAPRAEVHPEEAVALGAAVFAGQEGSAERLRDVTPLSLGVEVEGGMMDRLIPRNTPVPCARTASFTTTRDDQAELEVKVFQGERALARDNRALGRLVLGPLPPAPKGVPKVEITFSLDQDALLSVEARDTRTQLRCAAHIEARQGLTPQALQRLLDEATQARALDDEARALAAAVAELRQSLDDLRATLDDRDIPLSEAQRRRLRHLISQGSEALVNPSPAGVQAALAALLQAR